MLDLLSLCLHSDFSSMGARGGCLIGSSVFRSGMVLFVVLIAGVDLLQIADWHKLKNILIPEFFAFYLNYILSNTHMYRICART